MRYGFYMPTRGATAEPDALETLVTRGEALGFSSTMIADHIVFPVKIQSTYPYTADGRFPGHGDALEQLSLMAFVAAKTQRLRLVTSVMILPYRNPVFTAPYGQLDLSVSFDLTPRFSLGFEAINLTEEGVRSYGRDESNIWYLAEGSARYLVAARYRF